MNFYGDYHTHSIYSDGKSDIEDNIKKAIDIGLKEIAITDHSFICANKNAMNLNGFFEQKTILPKLRKKYPEISVLHSMELNLANKEGNLEIEKELFHKLDIIVAGFHLSSMVNKKNWNFAYKQIKGKLIKPNKQTIKSNTKFIVDFIRKNKIDILTHPGNEIFIDKKEVAKACGDYGTFYEINCKHFDVFEKDYKDLLSTNAIFIVNSDSHKIEDIGKFQEIEKFLTENNIEKSRIANWYKKPVFRSKL